MIDDEVVLKVGSKSFRGWSDYSIDSDMLQAADNFTMKLGGAGRAEMALLELDAEVEVYMGETRVLSGFLEDRTPVSSRDGGNVITIGGRDRAGRLLDEACELISFNNLGLLDLVQLVAGPWFSSIVTSNATNRRLLGGRGARMGKITKEPAIATGPNPDRKVQPGESRWQVIEHWASEAEVLVWAAADGRTLVIGLPNYAQAPSFRFFHPAESSPRAAEANLQDFQLHESVGDRFSKMVAVGLGTDFKRDGGDGSRYISVRGEATDGPGEHGIGKTFRQRKVGMVVDSDLKTQKQALRRAIREMAERDGAGISLEIQVAGHSQLIAGSRTPTLYAVDAMAHVESEHWGISGDWLITKRTFRRSRGAGRTTTMTLVPKGTTLRI